MSPLLRRQQLILFSNNFADKRNEISCARTPDKIIEGSESIFTQIEKITLILKLTVGL